MILIVITVILTGVRAGGGGGDDGWVIAPSGKKYKPEECGVDGNGNGWCAGEAVPPKLFMKPEPPPPPPPKKDKPKAQPAKKKDNKKKDSKKKDKKKDPKFENTGKIMAKKVLKHKGDSQTPAPPTKAWNTTVFGEPEPEPESMSAKSSSFWIILFLAVIMTPVGYWLWIRFQKEESLRPQPDYNANLTDEQKRTTLSGTLKDIQFVVKPRKM